MTRPSFIHRVSSALRLGYRLHGVRLPIVLVQRSWSLFAFRWFGAKKFKFAGRTHTYCCHHYSLDNERAVEVALARDFLLGKRGTVLEVGNVLSNYMSFPHDVVDKYEVTPGVINEDIVNFAPGKKYAGIISVSTLEHVGWDEQPRNPQKIKQAISHMKTLLAPGGWMFVTIPLGYNHNLDEMLRSSASGFSEIGYLLRISADNRWREAQPEEAYEAKYASPFPNANALFVGVFHKQQ